MGEMRKNYSYIILGKADELLPSLDASDVQEVNAQSILTGTQQQTHIYSIYTATHQLNNGKLPHTNLSNRADPSPPVTQVSHPHPVHQRRD